jgi:Protein of unknown function (DUF2933)
MQDHAHGHSVGHSTGSFWTSRAFLVCAVLLVIIGFLLWTEHLAHALGLLPYLLLLACPLMHLFMHRGHGGHGSHRYRERVERAPEGERS